RPASPTATARRWRGPEPVTRWTSRAPDCLKWTERGSTRRSRRCSTTRSTSRSGAPVPTRPARWTTCTPPGCAAAREVGDVPKLSYLKALNRALADELAGDPDVFLLGEDVRVAVSNVTAGLAERFGPERVLDTPLSEQAFTSFATGAALAGL